ncbi:MAG: penicillin-binding protein 2 [Candidatus Harrisonbacteria bacterium CG10_big_fil_rev_8_21_14_0_10_42_17]|uniref:Penicillin-binding protein 2 n=1 Tax=Candidatus Harrisonbacteria bacterium CG10_big_fil_rev_8_21_14_0_10_42_17 TaxID=1974584 RepID=A0A2M6WHW2_9BACT|nr:MAG: penicillin-binding protein 2 [Candidatus Harrisonbacteria bacterium CG10_big_fil_rev_8_21_14_0_10_42_17]
MKKHSHIPFEELAFDAVGEQEETIESPASRGLFILLGSITVVVGFLIMGRVGFLSVTRGEQYSNRANANVYKEIISPARRGAIVDRYEMVLAESKSSFSVFLNVADILKQPGSFEKIIQTLAETLNVEVEEIRSAALAINLEKENTIAVVRNLTSDEVIKVKGLALEGVEVHDDFIREYKDAKAFAHVVGYTGVGEDNSIEGKTGLEAYYDNILRGTDGKFIYYRDALGEVYEKKSFFEPVIGERLETTIDFDLQKYSYERLEQGLRTLGRTSGVAMALKPTTGEVLAMVNAPSFDSNIFVDRSRSAERGEVLTSENTPLFNRAISGAYEPGSTIKPLVALAALKEALIAPETKVYAKGTIEVQNPFFPEKPSIFKDWTNHGLVDLHAALARSSNIYFYGLGGGLTTEQSGTVPVQGLGIKKIKEYWQLFGLGKETGIDLFSENVGLLPDPEFKENRTSEPWRIGDTFNVSIGQGDLLVTPLQLINFFASIANNGIGYRPTVTQQEEHEVLYDYSSWKYELGEVQQGLIDAVKKPYGTAYRLSDLPMSVAGKTGSAQISNNTKINAFFLGYAPVENPEIVLLILVENAREGSINTLPIAKDILGWYYENRIAHKKVIEEEK